MEEIWKDIEGYEGYQVSNIGRIRSVDRVIYAVNRWGDIKPRRYKGKVISIHHYPNGYYSFVYHKRGTDKEENLLVHRLVAKAFVPGYFEGAVVNHKDENKGNNRFDNLEWVTDHENRVYGTAQERLHSSQCHAVEQIDLNGRIINTFPSIREAARAINGDMSTIRKICLAIKGGTYRGCKWKIKGDIERVRQDLRKTKIVQMSLEGNDIAMYDSIIEAAKKLNIRPGNISSVCRGASNTAGGYRWKYKQ